jgi:hypothetical protein
MFSDGMVSSIFVCFTLPKWCFSEKQTRKAEELFAIMKEIRNFADETCFTKNNHSQWINIIS